MASTIKFMLNAFDKAMTEYSDPRVEDWFLMKSIYPMLGVVGAYLYFVLNFGPRLMKNRKPFNIDRIVICYNVLQILTSVYIFITFCREVFPNYSFWCQPIDYVSEHGLFIAKHVWFFFILKVVDLLDTIFFILRKKQNHVSFLHVYHHAGMAVATWFGAKFFTGGNIVYLGGYNSVIHMFMYTYYLLAIWKKGLVQNIWWKKSLTKLQLIQFGLNIFQHFILLIQPSCRFSKFASCFLCAQNLFMVALFSDFYYRTYVKEEKFKTAHSQNGFDEKF